MRFTSWLVFMAFVACRVPSLERPNNPPQDAGVEGPTDCTPLWSFGAGLFNPQNAQWRLGLAPGLIQTGYVETTFTFGQAGDTPLIGDWDGDGVQTPGVWRAG